MIAGLSHDGELAGAQSSNKITAPEAMLIAVAETHPLRLTRLSENVQGKPQHERLLRLLVEHVWCRRGEASS
jgi:hypothetical protein